MEEGVTVLSRWGKIGIALSAAMVLLAVFGSIFIATQMARDSRDAPHLYRSGQRVDLGGRVSAVVPAGFQGFYSQYGAPTEGGVIRTVGFDEPGLDSVHSNLLRVDVGSTTATAYWSQIEPVAASLEGTGVFPSARATFVLAGGWTASVMTRNEARPNSLPLVLAVTYLRRAGSAPLRVVAVYHEASHEPSLPPDPVAMFQRVRSQLKLQL